jgi:transmembrane sensor
MSDDERRLDEAVAWHVRMTTGDADEAAWHAFTTWLEADTANRAAYDRVEDFDSGIDPLAVTPATVVAFRRAVPAMRQSWWAAGALVAASVVVVAGVAAWMDRIPATQYATGIGETKAVTLADGSVITLNTDTIVDATVSRHSRAVTLEHGEALFQVAKDKAYPFIVTVGDRHVRVVGTVFDIIRDKGAVAVVVAEGKVTVSQSGAAAPEVQLTPGERVAGREGQRLGAVETVNTAHALAWRQGYLIYDDAPLANVVNDLNRYFTMPVVLADDGVAGRRFSGVLRIDSETAMLGRIAQFLPVRVEQASGRIVLHNRRRPD